MAEQEQKRRPRRVKKVEEVQEEVTPQKTEQQTREEHLAELDALIDEIDGLLEEVGLSTSEECGAFVRGYQQKGGE